MDEAKQEELKRIIKEVKSVKKRLQNIGDDCINLYAEGVIPNSSIVVANGAIAAVVTLLDDLNFEHDANEAASKVPLGDPRSTEQ